ncbi:hypothetical protein PENSOL_c018G11203 [Penicillium solitum]|uniref:Uncharacterized protein n=1 Tax=Penicillium solitum TaxID=60172 RepID=A0A1V6R3C9_9EURO|nr:uncharacterized protein PENSOL_c018G11203 [Penicillium solitum]OQD95891.1 hypothetical protein PENSOL_c018G11203 [Penicillium solitum]
MSEPEWDNALPPAAHDPYGVPLLRPTPNLGRDVIELPVLSPNGLPEPHYKVIISRRVHEELESLFYVTHRMKPTQYNPPYNSGSQTGYILAWNSSPGVGRTDTRS